MARFKRAVGLAALVGLVVAGSATGGSASTGAGVAESAASGGKGGRGGSVTLETVAPPGSLDPSTSFWGPLSAYYEAVYDTLLRLDADGAVQPWLATEFSYDDAHTQLTLKLRDDVEFTDGSALTADVVARNLQRFKDGTSATAPKLASVTSIDAPDDQTVVINLSEPDPGLLTALAQEAGLIASGEALDDPDLATAPVGSGPYVLDTDETVIGSTYAYKKNKDYWNPDAQYFDSLVVRASGSPISIVNAIKAGEVDVALVGGEPQQPAEDAGWTVETVANGGFQGLMLFDRDGQLYEPLGDVMVRQAINYALDRKALLEASDGEGAPTAQIFSASGQAYDKALDKRYPYNPKKAKALLKKAGYPDGITLTLPDLGAPDNFAFLEENLAESGIKLDLVASQLASSVGDILAAKYAAVYFALGDPTDWGTVQQLVTPNASINPFKSTLPELDELIETMRTGDEKASADAARKINELMIEQAWFAPVASSVSVVGHGPDVKLANPTTRTFPSIYDIRPS